MYVRTDVNDFRQSVYYMFQCCQYNFICLDCFIIGVINIQGCLFAVRTSPHDLIELEILLHLSSIIIFDKIEVPALDQ
jgi:hypothetical protein